MDISVRTGSTKAGGQALLAESFDSRSGEKAIFLLQTAGGPDAESLSRECIGIVKHALIEGEGDPWHRLDGTLKELNGLFKGFLLSEALEETHAVVAMLDSGGTLHVSHAGRGEAYLVRGATTSQITEFTRGKPVSVFVHIASGALEPGDSVVLSTQRLLRTFTPAQLAAAVHGDEAAEEITGGLESERETAAFAIVQTPRTDTTRAVSGKTLSARLRSSGGRRPLERGAFGLPSVAAVLEMLKGIQPVLSRLGREGLSLGKKSMSTGATLGSNTGPALSRIAGWIQGLLGRGEEFMADLRDPQRKRRAHLLLLAGAVATFLVILLVVNVATNTQRNKTRTDLSVQMEQIKADIQTADNRKLAGDTGAANTILERAEEQAKQVMDSPSGLFRSEALDLLDRIRQKREEMNNILRVSPRVVVNISSENPDAAAQGLIGLSDGEFIIYDRQNSYRVLLNKLDEPHRVSDEELILLGAYFSRLKTQVFLTTGNSLIEMAGGQATPMKTDDPNGWIAGKDLEAYLRYLYVLSPDKKQIYKYERLANRYGAPVGYNVNGDLTGAIDMSIDGSVYVLKEGGGLLKLLRGEAQPFKITGAPTDLLKTATKIYKDPDGKFYFLDPVNKRVIVVADGGLTGEAKYDRQFVMEGEQLGTLQDLYVDSEQTHLYVLDEKRVFVVDLGATQ